MAAFNLTIEDFGVNRHCMAIVDDEKLFLAGGWNGQLGEDASIYNRNTGEWTRISSTFFPRDGLACGMIVVNDTNEDEEARNVFGFREIVAVGGAREGDVFTDHVEIYSVEDDDWRAGNFLISP